MILPKIGEEPKFLIVVKHDPVLRRFFSKIWEDNTILNVFTTHGMRLSLSEDERIPLFFNSTSDNGPVNLDVIKEIEEKTKNELESYFWQNIDSFQALAIDIVKELPDSFFEIMNKAQYMEGEEGPPINEILGSLFQQKVPEDQDEGDQPKSAFFDIMQKKIFSVVLEIIAPAIVKGLQSTQFKYLEAGEKHSNEIRQICDISEDDYQELIEALVIMQILNPFVTLHWCDEHIHQPFSTYSVSHNILPIVICPTCNNRCSSGTFYFIHPIVFRMIRKDGGILPIAILWELDKRGIPWVTSVTYDSKEVDIICKDQNSESYILIECKVVDSYGKREASLYNQLYNHIRDQVQPSLNWFEKLKVPITHALLICNIADVGQIDRINKKIDASGLVKSKNRDKIRIISIRDLPGYANDWKLSFDENGT